MDTKTVVDIVERITYKPGWQFRIAMHTDSVVYVNVRWYATDSNAYPDYDASMRIPFVRTVVIDVVNDDWTELTVLRTILDEIINLEADMICHDAREFFRVKDDVNYPAPFHPHHWGETPGKRGRINWKDTMSVQNMNNAHLPNYVEG